MVAQPPNRVRATVRARVHFDDKIHQKRVCCEANASREGKAQMAKVQAADSRTTLHLPLLTGGFVGLPKMRLNHETTTSDITTTYTLYMYYYTGDSTYNLHIVLRVDFVAAYLFKPSSSHYRQRWSPEVNF